jgi:hypothetical protein
LRSCHLLSSPAIHTATPHTSNSPSIQRLSCFATFLRSALTCTSARHSHRPLPLYAHRHSVIPLARPRRSSPRRSMGACSSLRCARALFLHAMRATRRDPTAEEANRIEALNCSQVIVIDIGSREIKVRALHSVACNGLSTLSLSRNRQASWALIRRRL